MEIAIVTDWTSRRLAVAKHSGAVPWHCTSELSSRGEDVAPALLLTCPAGAHFPQTILQHHPQAAVGRCQRLDVSQSPKARKVAVRRFRQVRAALMSTRVRRPQLRAATSRLPGRGRWRSGRPGAQLAPIRGGQGRGGKPDSWPCPKTYNPLSAWQLVRKRTTVYERSMPHFHVWIVEEIWRGRAGVVALVRLETNFEYRTAAVRSAPPGSLFRVFLCREEH